MADTETPLQLPEDWAPIQSWLDFLYPQQYLFLHSKAFKRFFISGNGSGKSILLALDTALTLLGIHPNQVAPPPIRVQVLVPSYDHAEKVFLEKLSRPQTVEQNGKVLAELGPMLPNSMIAKGYTKDHRTLDLKNGSNIHFVTPTEGRLALRGYEHDYLIMDEESPEECFDECVRGLRNARGGGRIVCALTPPYLESKGPTWTKKIVEESLYDDNIFLVKASMSDNPAVSEFFIREFSKGKSPEQLQVQLHGNYPSWGKVIFYPFENRPWDEGKCEGHILPAEYPMPEDDDVEWFQGIDWHSSKPCASVYMYRDSDGNFVIYDELDPVVAADKEISELCEIFRQMEGHTKYSKRRFRRFLDPSAKSKYQAMTRGFSAWSEFRKNGIICAEGKNTEPEVSIGLINELLKGNCKTTPRLWIKANCKHTIESFSSHYWVRKEDGTGRPDPKFSDLPICVRYVVQAVSGVAKKDRKRWPLVSYPTSQEKGATDLSRWV